MSIRLKVAKSAKEIDDVMWLRHQVYVVEDGKFSDTPMPEKRILDRFDTMPGVVNLIAYNNDEPVGTVRVNQDCEIGLPPESHYDFGQQRTHIEQHLSPQKPRFASGGMLAITEKWRSRRDVIRALYKMLGSVFYRWGTTHILATVNHETVSMYRRLGFKVVDDKQWVDSIGNHVIPLVADAHSYYKWAFGNIPTNGHPNISDNFELLLLRSGEVIFSKGDSGQYAFIVDEGQIRINGSSPAGDVLTLATIGPGELFGELSLIDDHPRNANALALTDAELIILDRNAFKEISDSDTDTLDLILRTLAARTRRIDDMAMVFAYEPLRKRMEMAYKEMQERAVPQRKDPKIRVLKLAPQEFAQCAGVDEEMAMSFLKSRQARGEIELRSQTIRFVA